MKKALRFIALVLAGVLCAAAFAGCGGSENGVRDGDNSLLGRWVSVDDPQEQIVFNADLTGEYAGESFTYAFGEGGTFRLTTVDAQFVYSYKVEGDTLTLRDEVYGDELTFYRDGSEPPSEGELTGTWANSDDENDVIAFNADGTGYNNNVPFTYVLYGSNGMTVSIEIADDIEYTYRIYGDTLVLHDEFYGDDVVYYRRG